MKKLIAVGAATALVLALFGAPATGKGKKQVVEGTIVAPSLNPTNANDCFPGIHRRVAIVSTEVVNGDFGYHFDIDPATNGKNFVLEVTGGQGTPDLDIFFYSTFGTMEQVVMDPTQAGAPPTVRIEHRGPGGESGKVPDKFYKKAIVCVFGGAPAAAVSFTYTAGKGVKLPK